MKPIVVLKDLGSSTRGLFQQAASLSEEIPPEPSLFFRMTCPLKVFIGRSMMNALHSELARPRLDQSDARQAGCVRNCKVCTGTSGSCASIDDAPELGARTPGTRTRRIIWLPDPASSSAGEDRGPVSGRGFPGTRPPRPGGNWPNPRHPSYTLHGRQDDAPRGSVRSNSRRP
jgi:hypothetical protein